MFWSYDKNDEINFNDANKFHKHTLHHLKLWNWLKASLSSCIIEFPGLMDLAECHKVSCQNEQAWNQDTDPYFYELVPGWLTGLIIWYGSACISVTMLGLHCCYSLPRCDSEYASGPITATVTGDLVLSDWISHCRQDSMCHYYNPDFSLELFSLFERHENPISIIIWKYMMHLPFCICATLSWLYIKLVGLDREECMEYDLSDMGDWLLYTLPETCIEEWPELLCQQGLWTVSELQIVY